MPPWLPMWDTGGTGAIVRLGVDGEVARVSGSPTGTNVGLHGRLTYDVNFSSFYLRPQMDLQVNWLRTGSYQEHGSELFDLTADSSSKLVFSATPALEIGTQHTLKGGGISRFYAVAGVTAFANDNWSTVARFTAAPADAGSFRTDLNNPNVGGTLRAGSPDAGRGALDVGLEYDAYVASHIVANSGVLRLNFHF